MLTVMPNWHIPNSAAATLLFLAVLGFLAPHLLMLGFRAAGAPPPAALVYLCPLHSGGTPAAPVDRRLGRAGVSLRSGWDRPGAAA